MDLSDAFENLPCFTCVVPKQYCFVRRYYHEKHSVAYPGILFWRGGGSTNSVEDRENGDLGAVAP